MHLFAPQEDATRSRRLTVEGVYQMHSRTERCLMVMELETWDSLRVRWEERTAFSWRCRSSPNPMDTCNSTWSGVKSFYLGDMHTSTAPVNCLYVKHFDSIYHTPVFVHPCNSRNAAIHLQEISILTLLLGCHIRLTQDCPQDTGSMHRPNRTATFEPRSGTSRP